MNLVLTLLCKRNVWACFCHFGLLMCTKRLEHKQMEGDQLTLCLFIQKMVFFVEKY